MSLSFKRKLILASALLVPAALHFVLADRISLRPRTLPIGQTFDRIATSHSGQWIAFAGSEGIVLYDFSRESIALHEPLRNAVVKAMSVAQDDNVLHLVVTENVKGGWTTELRHWDSRSGKEMASSRRQLPDWAASDRVLRTLSRDGSRLVVKIYVAAHRYDIQPLHLVVTDTAKGRRVSNFSTHKSMDVLGAAVSPTCRYLAVLETRDRVALWNLETASLSCHISLKGDTAPRLAFSQDERHLVLVTFVSGRSRDGGFPIR